MNGTLDLVLAVPVMRDAKSAAGRKQALKIGFVARSTLSEEAHG